MANGVFNIAKGAVAEKIRDAAANVIVILMQANEAEGALVDHDELDALFTAAGNTEADFASYSRKTGVTGTVLVDDTNDWVDVDIPDQTWSAATTGQTLTKLITAYEDSAAETGRVPLTHHDFAVTTDGSDITAQINTEGFFRAT